MSTDTTDDVLSIMDDKEPKSAAKRVCGCVMGAGVTTFALLLISAESTNIFLDLRPVLFLILGLNCLGGACINSVRKAGDIEYVERTNQTCPKCGAEGTIEIYNKKTVKRIYYILSSTVETTLAPMVNCMNVHCSYRVSYASYSKEMSERARTRLRETLIESHRMEMAVSSSSEGNNSGPADYAESSPAPEERASSALEALEEEARRQKLRRQKRLHYNRCTCIVHLESERLKADGFGSCPECANPVNFRTLGGCRSVAECSGNTCGYISTLTRHKKACRDAASGMDVDVEQGGLPSYEMRSMLAYKY